MREIKFRIWNDHGQCMHQWPELIEKNKINLLNAKNPTYRVMQFTGLKDLNGVDIYEGDIVETSFLEDYDNECQFVEYGAICTGAVERHVSGEWLVVDDRDRSWLSLYHVSDYARTSVIGSIHEKPELIG